MHILTERQEDVLEVVVRFFEREERPPTTRELAEELRCHVKTVYQYILVLERKGYIERRKGRIRLAPGLGRGKGIPIVGRVAAGAPILAIQNREGALSLDSLFGTEEDAFAVRAEGDSMVGAGILDGDWVVVRNTARVGSGELAVCYLGPDADVTVKRLIEHSDYYELMPANEAYEPIRVPRDDPHFRIAGKVVGVVRKVR
ncbi:MAG: repressor LexA [Candidatus Hydrogenedentota bacterium]|nr:MAG: repressor LexA [Candidatus Hydrogenedentota bacterium]